MVFRSEDVFAYPFLLPLFVLPLLFLILRSIGSSSSSESPFPPGPKPWPIVGNLLQIGEKAHISITHFAQIYGPLISLRLGTQLLVVASSPAAASEILKTHDRLLSARYIFQITSDKAKRDRLSLVFSSKCDDSWRILRSICRTNLFAARAIESQACLRQRKVNELVDVLQSKQGSVVEIRDLVFTTVYNTLSNLIFSMDLLDFVGDGFNGIKQPFQKSMTLGLTPNLADFYPSLNSLDLQGLRKKADILVKKIESSWEVLIQERRKIQRHHSSPANDFLDALIDSGFTDDQINYLIIEVLSAGTDTTTTTVEWAMAALLKNRGIMDKVREEIETEFNQNAIINESNVSQLHYLHACIKETLRLYPPAPFLLPRLAPEACEVMGYSIPENTRIFVNVWGIGRDPSIWEDPLMFKPERFIGSDLDFKGYDYRFLPFGGGRRICPGLPMATLQVALILATLIHNFHWDLPNGEDFAELDLTGKLGITMHKEKPLLLIPRKRL